MLTWIGQLMNSRNFSPFTVDDVSHWQNAMEEVTREDNHGTDYNHFLLEGFSRGEQLFPGQLSANVAWYMDVIGDDNSRGVFVQIDLAGSGAQVKVWQNSMLSPWRDIAISDDFRAQVEQNTRDIANLYQELAEAVEHAEAYTDEKLVEAKAYTDQQIDASMAEVREVTAEAKQIATEAAQTASEAREIATEARHSADEAYTAALQAEFSAEAANASANQAAQSAAEAQRQAESAESQVEVARAAAEAAQASAEHAEEVAVNKTEKKLLSYNGTNILAPDGSILTFAQLYNWLMNDPYFVVLVYNNYAYHPNGVSTSQIVFSSEFPVNSYDRAHRITMLPSGVITITETESEHTISRVSVISDANKGSTVQYTSVKAVADYVDPTKAEVADHEVRIDNLEARPAVDPSIERGLENLEAAADGNLYRENVDTSAAYEKAIESDVLPWATLDSIGGHTEVVDGVLTNYSTEAVVSRGKNLVQRGETFTFPSDQGVIVLVDFGRDVTFDAITLSMVAKDYRYGNNSGALVNFQQADGTNYYITPQIFGLNVDSSNTGVFSLTRTDITFRQVRFYATGYSMPSGGSLKFQLERGSLTDYSAPFEQSIDTSDLAKKYFPNGMKSVGTVCDELDLKNKIAIQRVGDAASSGLSYNVLPTPIITPITEDFDTALNVEAGGSLTFVNDKHAAVPVPNQETFLKKITGVKSVSVAGTALAPDADGNVDLPVATTSNLGLVKPGSGITINSAGTVGINVASELSIDRRSEGRPMDASVLDYAVRAGLISNSRIIDADKPAICETIGAAPYYNWEHIDTITINSTDSVDIDLAAEPDGTPYNFDQVFVQILLKPAAELLNYGQVFFAHDSKVIVRGELGNSDAQNVVRMGYCSLIRFGSMRLSLQTGMGSISSPIGLRTKAFGDASMTNATLVAMAGSQYDTPINRINGLRLKGSCSVDIYAVRNH